MSDQEKESHIISCSDGVIKHIYSDELAGLSDIPGSSSISRASHVEPSADGSWIADLRPCGGPVLHGFRLRAEALAAEKEWIEENILKAPPQEDQ